MNIQFRKAERSKSKLRLGLCGPAGSGKTRSALELAKGLGGKTAFIDSENGSGDLYADNFDYDIVRIASPFTCERYIEAIRAAESAGYDNIIIDSLSHAWSGEGGLLDQQGRWTDKEKGNSYTAWRHVTPLHNRLIETMLQSKCHIIATMRSKVEYVLMETVNRAGAKVMAPKKVGMAPVQREGMDYEFTVVFDIDADHEAKASKDRTGMFDSPLPFRIDAEVGRLIGDWLNTGKEPEKTVLTCERCVKSGEISDAVEGDCSGSGYLHLCQKCLDAWAEMKAKSIQPQEGDSKRQV